MKKRNKKLFPVLLLFTGFTLMVFSGCGGNPPVESITLVPKEFHFYDIGEKKQLTATVLPENAHTNIVWTSSDESVAIVNDSGIVTAVGSGLATITATAGKKTATCEVKVSTGHYFPLFHKIIYTKFDVTDVIDMSVGIDDDGYEFADTLARIDIILLGTDTDLSSTGYIVGSGILAYMKANVLFRKMKTGPYAGKSYPYITGRYVASDMLPATIDEWTANQNTHKFLKGEFDVTGFNATANTLAGEDLMLLLKTYMKGSKLFYLNSPLNPSGGLEPYGVIAESEFEIDKNGFLFPKSYSLTGQIILWLYEITNDVGAKEMYYIDASGTIWLPQEEGDTDVVKLVTLNSWIKTHNGAPANVIQKAVVTKISTAHINKFRAIKNLPNYSILLNNKNLIYNEK